MNICFISYWGLNEGLTQATVLPHLKILSEFEQVKSIRFITMERGEQMVSLQLNKVQHHGIDTSTSSLAKLTDGKKVNELLQQLHQETPVDLLMARGTLAAWTAMRFVEKYNVPFTVESFEPHADYMLQDGVWKRLGLKYQTLKHSEDAQKKKAMFLMPVTAKYAAVLEHEKIDSARIRVMPCAVDPEKFAFTAEDRKRVRETLKLGDDRVVGVYTGKIGGIYFGEEAVQLIRHAEAFFGEGKFFLLILSPDRVKWEEALLRGGMDRSNFHIDLVQLDEVSAYLSASDFAFSLHKPTPAKIAISPIKNAEYFMNGLPIVMHEGIGDDGQIIKELNFGYAFKQIENINPSDFEQVGRWMKEDRLNGKITSWAKENRSFNRVREVYQEVLSSAGS